MNLDSLLFRNSFYDVFGFSTRSLGHVMFSFAGTAQKAGAGGRSGAVGGRSGELVVDRGQLVSLFAIYHQLLLSGQFPRTKTSRDQDF